MGYKAKPVIKLDLPDNDDYEGFWVEIRNPAYLQWDTMSAFLDLVPGGVQPGQPVKINPSAGKDIAAQVIVKWNLTSIDGGEEVLPIPLQDPNVWVQVPSWAIIQQVMDYVNENGPKAAPDPNSSSGSTSSSQAGPSEATSENIGSPSSANAGDAPNVS